MKVSVPASVAFSPALYILSSVFGVPPQIYILECLFLNDVYHQMPSLTLPHCCEEHVSGWRLLSCPCSTLRTIFFFRGILWSSRKSRAWYSCYNRLPVWLKGRCYLWRWVSGSRLLCWLAHTPACGTGHGALPVESVAPLWGDKFLAGDSRLSWGCAFCILGTC